MPGPKLVFVCSFSCVVKRRKISKDPTCIAHWDGRKYCFYVLLFFVSLKIDMFFFISELRPMNCGGSGSVCSFWYDFATVTPMDNLSLLFTPVGLPRSSRREGWPGRKGRKGDFSQHAPWVFLLALSALLLNLCDPIVHLSCLSPLFQKHTDGWSKESGLQRGLKKATQLEMRAHPA